MKKEERTLLEKLQEAWAELPDGAKSIVFEQGYIHQTISHILKNGRKDEKILTDLMEVIKTASAQAAQKAQEQNEKVQAV